MNDLSNPINWLAFKSALEQNPDLHLQFEYEEGKLVDPSFHITEIKQAPIVSVDCGGVMNSWTEVIVQLWEPPVKQTDRSMRASKALKIVSLVEKLLPLDPDAVVKIEFGNSRFDTRQMYPGDFRADEGKFTVSLVPDFTQCKAQTRNQTCAAGESSSACCGSKPETRERVVPESAACTPGTGCC